MRGAASKVMWVGRATVFLVGLAVILALVFGVATTALGANGNPFLLGKKNVASAISTLVKQGPGPALKLQVGAGQPPLAVNSPTKVANLNADAVDGLDSTALLPGGDLPRGRTVRGNYDIRDYAAPSSYGWDSSAISFGYRLASSPTVRIIKAGATAPAECPGSESSPEAAPGYLCVYEASGNNLFNSDYPATTNISREGASLYAFSTNNGSPSAAQFSAWGTWAVTGN